MKKVMIIVLSILTLGLGITAWQLGWISFEREPSHEQWVLGEFLVNLQQDRSYLRTRVVVEYVDNSGTRNVLDGAEAKARDTVIGVLRSHSAEELRNGEIDDLRKRLLDQLRQELDLKEGLVSLYFVEFVIQ